jgi:hypothetical protein
MPRDPLSGRFISQEDLDKREEEFSDFTDEGEMLDYEDYQDFGEEEYGEPS